MNKTILYLGDGPVAGPACYLLGILKHAGYRVSHIFDGKLEKTIFSREFSAIIISDYPKSKISSGAMRKIEQNVREGTGLLMIGGWSSYTGLHGNYRASAIEKMLPVLCFPKDDRRNLESGGILIQKNRSHPLLKGIPIKPSPVIIGYNKVRVKKGAEIVLEVEENISRKRNPLLVLGGYGQGKTVAWTTDVAPHWCGGLVDWGSRRLRLKVAKHIVVEVGDRYVKFFTQLLHWLEKKNVKVSE